MELSYSKIKSWRNCRQAYVYAHVDRIEPKLKPKPMALGSAVHRMVETFRKGNDWKEVYAELLAEYEKMFPEEKEHYGNIPQEAKDIFEGYLEEYADADKGLVYHLIEDKVNSVELTEGVNFILRPDSLAEDTMGRMWLIEVKTGKSIPDEKFRMWDLQTLLYIWGLREVGYKVDGVIWDHIRTKTPTVPRLLKDGTMSKRVLDTTPAVYRRAVIEAGLDPADYDDVLGNLATRASFYARYKVPVREQMMNEAVAGARKTAEEIRDARPEDIYRNIDKMRCGFCMYSPLCEAVMMGGDEEFIREKQFVEKPKNY